MSIPPDVSTVIVTRYLLSHKYYLLLFRRDGTYHAQESPEVLWELNITARPIFIK